MTRDEEEQGREARSWERAPWVSGPWDADLGNRSAGPPSFVTTAGNFHTQSQFSPAVSGFETHPCAEGGHWPRAHLEPPCVVPWYLHRVSC